VARKTILFVDDEVVLHALVGGALEDEGFEVVCARTGADALEVLQQGARFDLVISDISMPGGVSGIDLARRALEVDPAPQVILASGHPKAQLDAFPPGVAFLPKPYLLSQLLVLIDP
jgi:CheY-like chemotaxis protein